jgi:hypothetical protein
MPAKEVCNSHQRYVNQCRKYRYSPQFNAATEFPKSLEKQGYENGSRQNTPENLPRYLLYPSCGSFSIEHISYETCGDSESHAKVDEIISSRLLHNLKDWERSRTGSAPGLLRCNVRAVNSSNIHRNCRSRHVCSPPGCHGVFRSLSRHRPNNTGSKGHS